MKYTEFRYRDRDVEASEPGTAVITRAAMEPYCYRPENAVANNAVADTWAQPVGDDSQPMTSQVDLNVSKELSKSLLELKGRARLASRRWAQFMEQPANSREQTAFGTGDHLTDHYLSQENEADIFGAAVRGAEYDDDNDDDDLEQTLQRIYSRCVVIRQRWPWSLLVGTSLVLALY